MADTCEAKHLVTANGRSLHVPNEIGFSNSLHVPQYLGGGESDSALVEERCTVSETVTSDSESDTCDSGTELDNENNGLTEQNSEQNKRLEHYSDDVSVSVPSSPETERGRKTTRFPKQDGKFKSVGFLNVDTMDNGDTKRQEINKDLSKLSRKGTGSVRYTQPRLSLLGKPINYKQHKRDANYRRLQSRIYNFLERPKAWYAFLYHIGICLLCIGMLVLSTLSTIKRFEPLMSTTVMYMEPVLLLWLMTEYSARVWSSGCRSRYQGWQGRLRFAQRPLCIVELTSPSTAMVIHEPILFWWLFLTPVLTLLLSMSLTTCSHKFCIRNIVIIVATILVLVVGSTSTTFAPSTLRGLRFFQILRMVRIDRRAGTWKLLASVVWAHRRELLTTLYIGFLGLMVSSFLVYLAEKDANVERFGTFADALWWGVVTLCTVGYGDVVPSTWAGKLIASFSAVLGISFFALPAGILGSGFALKVQEQQRHKHLIRRRVPAALLIQSLWRCYAADENSMSIATWKPHMVPCPSPTQERPFKNNTSFVSRFSTKRKERSSSGTGSGNISPHSPMLSRSETRKNGSCSEEEIPDTLHRSHLSLATGLVDQRVDRIALMKEPSLQSFSSKNDHNSEDEPDLSPKVRELTEVHKRAIRALRKIKYFASRKKFREALRPYDVKDVIEQYSAGHVDMLGRVKSLQCRLDQILGKQGSKNKDVYESKVSLSSRIVKVERQVEDIESKLDLLIDLYKEDRKTLLQDHKRLPDSPPADGDGREESGPKPRSILVDKQYTSEPSSPITNRHPKRIMQRNHSDLSSRMRKRVTYRFQTGSANFCDNPFKIPENTFCDYQQFSAGTDCYRKFELPVGNQASNHVTKQSPSGGGVVENGLDSWEGQQKVLTPSEYFEQPDSQHSLADISFCEPITPESGSPKRLCNTDFTSLSVDEIDEFKASQEQMKAPRSPQSSDHVVLMPLGSPQALVADVSDV